VDFYYYGANYYKPPLEGDVQIITPIPRMSMIFFQTTHTGAHPIAHVHTHKHKYTHSIHISTYTHTDIHKHTDIHIHTHTHTHTHKHIRAHTITSNMMIYNGVVRKLCRKLHQNIKIKSKSSLQYQIYCSEFLLLWYKLS